MNDTPPPSTPRGAILDRTPEICRLGAHDLAAAIRGARGFGARGDGRLSRPHRTHQPRLQRHRLAAPRAPTFWPMRRRPMRGWRRGQPVGPLHGVPQAVKDLAATKGLRTTQGSPIFADTVPDYDQLIVERARAAGAIVIGKTNSPEFGLGSNTYNSVFGITRNAYDTTRSSGGSSGAARRWRWPRACCRWPMAPTMRGRCAIPPAGTTSSVSARPWAACRRCRMTRCSGISNRPKGRWAARWWMSPHCSRCRPL